jgi:probable rRNA maturation factor
MAAKPGHQRIHVTVTNTTGRPVAVRGLGPWLARLAPARAGGEVSLAFVTDARIRALNRAYRGADQATDVLSFPADPSHRPVDGALGDIAIAAGVAARQARAAGHTFGTEARVLALHGLLHLLGYDHDIDDGEMAKLEHRLRLRGGLREGLIARAHANAR